jgi:DNA-binding FadR family transcriptional regulator
MRRLINQSTPIRPNNAPVPHDDTLQQLREFIDTGDYAPGDRLPPERTLISSLGVTRNALRKGLEALEREGAIWRHVGKGTFITTPQSLVTVPGLAELSHQVTPIQMMRARLSLEPAIAREAAANASGDAVQRITTARDRALDATSWDTYEANDDAFHRCLAEATGNVLLLSLFDHLNQVRRAVAWQKVVRASDRPPATHSSYREHDDIVEAIQQRNPTAAHTAMRAHLNSVSNRLYGDD